MYARFQIDTGMNTTSNNPIIVMNTRYGKHSIVFLLLFPPSF